MSVSRDFYVIAGYDLTGWDTDKLRDWKWEEGEEYICNHSKGNIQLHVPIVVMKYISD